MPAAPQHVTVSLRPECRVAVMPVRTAVHKVRPAVYSYPQVLYSAHHTTAGFLDAEARAQTANQPQAVRQFLASYRDRFPRDAGYQHDQMHLRTELGPAQRQCEPRNADAHLIYISAGLQACIRTTPDTPLALVDLDGVNMETGDHRTRYVTAIGFSESEPVATFDVEVPAPSAEVGARSLHDPRLGLVERVQAALTAHNVSYGCVRLALAGDTASAALVMNEYEPQLMHHDLARVLRASRHRVEPVPAADTQRLQTAPANTSSTTPPTDLRLSDTLCLMVRPPADNGTSRIVQGRYQSPILMHWAPHARTVRATVIRYT